MATEIQPSIATAAKSVFAKSIFVLVRGYLGSFMPGHFRRVESHLQKKAGELHSRTKDAFIAATNTRATMAVNASLLEKHVSLKLKLAHPGDRLIFLSHSKGGLETLKMLKSSPEIAARTGAAVLMQTPRRGAPYLESVFFRGYPYSSNLQRLKERTHEISLRTIGAGKSGRELSARDRLPFVDEIDGFKFPFPIFSYSSFTTVASPWVEIQSRRLAEIRPGEMNDGVFATGDLVWPQFIHREIQELDHAEPTVGSRRIDEVKLWNNILKECELL